MKRSPQQNTTIFTQRLFWLPLLLFLLLSSLCIFIGTFLVQKDLNVRKQKADSVMEQSRSYLQSFSAERMQALINLMDIWPSNNPNIEDWFNVQAQLLTSTQQGFSSLVLANANKKITWIYKPSDGKTKSRLDASYIGESLEETGLVIDPMNEDFANELISVPEGWFTQHHLLVGRAVSPQEQNHGYLIAIYDLNYILTLVLGDLTSLNNNYDLQFNIQLTDNNTILLESGDFIEQDSQHSETVFEFLNRTWALKVQARQQGLPTGLLFALLGTFMSLLLSIFLYYQLKNALKLSVSQQRYKTASRASLDAILIYEKVGDDFAIREANPIALKMFSQEQLDRFEATTLKDQLVGFGHEALFKEAKTVFLTGEPFESHLDMRNTPIRPDWLKIQIVKADKYLTLTLRDVTARFSAQLALEKSEEKYRRLVDGLYLHFIYTKTPQHGFEYVSAGVKDILGHSTEDFCQNSEELVASQPDNWQQIKDKLNNGEQPEPYIVEYVSKEGDLIAIEFADTPVLDDKRKLIAIEGIAQDVTKQRALQKKVNYQASHDQLTGLLNRYAFDRKLKNTLTKVKNHKLNAVLCYLDMDRFKLVNDSCGHPAGDQLLKEIATIFTNHISDIDTLARVGGDEFCIIYQNASLADVTARLDELLNAISSYRFTYEEKVFFIGASIGVLEIDDKFIDAAELVKAADNACYKAKMSGRNKYQIFKSSDLENQVNSEESNTLAFVHSALLNNSFELYCQVIEPLLKKTKGLHYEILLRLPNRHGEMISPAYFIPVAERHGLMNKIDLWVIDQTLSALDNAPEHCEKLDKVAINLSGLTLGNEDMLNKIVERIKRSKLPTHKICFEITETVAVTNLSAAQSFIACLRTLGCRFALDDFGAGMSSFTYLKNLEVDYVKIDGSFVRNMCSDSIDAATVNAINTIAQSMGKETVAEFVSNKETVESLRELNVDYAQGFALGQPVAFHSVLDDEAKLTLNAQH